ncbi:egt [Clostera anastomosis granulovirus A]|uniref:Ecdysteroid UDP-glucosyltransferase n=1 Tax=Clostera anastomosis granulovirus A TaxID=1986289 RepID=U5KBB7_9BBAC|nr:egt [Clostera anastomosis granulovirus Henan]AGQ20380.1 egt [Clostera anastomosis granulovirus Henan]
MTPVIALFLAVLQPNLVWSANILCVFPTPAYSHQSVFAAYVDRLAYAGHNVTVITPMPRRVRHLTEVECNLSASYFANLVRSSTLIKKRGAVADEETVTANNYTPLVDMVVEQFASENVTALVENTSNQFDLVVCEAYLSVNLVFGHLFNAPVILMSSGFATNENFKTINRHVLYDHKKYPNMWRSNFNGDGRLSEKRLSIEWSTLEKIQESKARSLFGNSVPSMAAMKARVAMLFVNVPSLYDGERPVNNRVQYLGGLHLKRPRPITDDRLTSFMKKHKVLIYVSFGSSLDAITMDASLLTEMIRSFASVSCGVLWRIDESVHSSYNVSSNVFTQNWFPQRDLLNHPKVKLFLTQGGVQSVDEAVDGEVPMIGLAMVGDQFYSTRRISQLGIGTALDVLRLEEFPLDRVISSMIDDPSYVERIRDFKKYIRDTTKRPLKKALLHTERVLKNARNMFEFNDR